MPIIRALDEQLKALLEGISALENGQEENSQEIQKGLEDMQKSQEETKNEKNQQCGRENNIEVEEKIVVVEEKITVVEQRIKEQVEERIEKVAENFTLISQLVEDLEKKLLVCANKNENKISFSFPVPVSTSPVPVSVTSSPVSVKLSTYDGKTKWEGGEAAEVLQTLPDTERLNLYSLYNVLDLRFGQKYSEYARLQMKTRFQKNGVSLPEYTSEVERLAKLAFSDHLATVREIISLQDGLKVGEIQKAVRMADVQDLKYDLSYALKLEATTQSSR
ncbi:uncharacterized protein TNCV_1059261 [Trichonephila clavipes]|nr:uncharacterized protein TNCV_1059261 [Trichonephila clavipes]